jgi:hypothetical protein
VVIGSVVSLAGSFVSSTSDAQSGGTSFSLPRQSIDGGAARSASASFVVVGTVAQPDAGPAMSSTSYQVHGGFHVAVRAALSDDLFANSFED